MRELLFDQEGSLDMDMSLTQGDQRCHSDTVASLVSAEAKYQGVLQESADAAAVGIARPDNYRARKLEAQYDLFDARVRHASTPQGAADLTARVLQLAQADHYHLLGTRGRDVGMPDYAFAEAEAEADYLECIEAIAEGIRMRKRNQSIADLNLNNHRLTPQEAAELGRYPNAREQCRREATIAHAERQSAGVQAPDPSPPASTEAERTVIWQPEMSR